MRSRRIAVLLVAATAPVLAVAACSSSGSSGGSSATSSSGTYVIGYSNGLTGLSAGSTVPGSKMIQAAFNVVNASGGIHGHHVRVILLDQGNPGSGQASVNVTQLATEDHASAIIGMQISQDCASVVSLATKYTTPLVCERTATSDLSPVQNYVFNGSSSEIAEVAPQVAVLKKLVHNPHPRVAILTAATIGSETWAAALQKAVQAIGGSVVSYQVLPLTATSVTVPGEQIIAAHPDVLFGEIFQQFWVPLLTQMKSAGVNVPVITTDSDVFYSDMGSLKMPNLYETAVTEPISPTTTNPQQKTLVAAMSKLMGGTADDLNAGEGTVILASAYVVISALEKCGYPCPAPNMAAALAQATTTVDGLAPAGFGYTPSLHFGVKQYFFYHWDPTVNGPVSVATEPAANPVTGVPGS